MSERASPVLFAYLTKYKELFVSPVTAVFPAAVEYVTCCPLAKILFADVIKIKSLLFSTCVFELKVETVPSISIAVLPFGILY